MDSREQEELAKAVIELIARHEGVQAAVMECACNCPNIVVEY